MRKYVSLVLLGALALLVFAPAALAQQMEDDKMMDSGSASASAMMMDSASASAMMGDDLPRTGGTPLLPLLSAAALAVMVGSGLVAARLVRSNS